jgi:hypothetical protein
MIFSKIEWIKNDKWTNESVRKRYLYYNKLVGITTQLLFWEGEVKNNPPREIIIKFISSILWIAIQKEKKNTQIPTILLVIAHNSIRVSIWTITFKMIHIKLPILARHWLLTPVILATQEAEIRRIAVRSQQGKQSVRPYLEKSAS